MKNLKAFFRKSIIILLPVLLFSSCAKYQYAFIESEIYQKDSQKYQFENDTLSIKYSFKGPDLRISILIYNKLNIPIYIDLSRSIVIYNTQQFNNIYSGLGHNGFLAPQSYITLKSWPIPIKMINLSKSDSVVNSKNYYTTMDRHIFDDKSSPIRLRSILAVATNEYLDQPTFYDTPFWISDIVPSKSSSLIDVRFPHDKIYMKKKEKNGNGIAGLLVLLTGLLIIRIL